MSHIMISYNWSHQNQTLVKKVAKGLEKRGLPIWIDLEEMSGGIDQRYCLNIFVKMKSIFYHIQILI